MGTPPKQKLFRCSRCAHLIAWNAPRCVGCGIPGPIARNEAHGTVKPHKFITNAVLWVLGCFFLFVSLAGLLTGDLLPALVVLLAGLLLLPPSFDLFVRQSRLRLSPPFRTILVLLLLVAFGITASKKNHRHHPASQHHLPNKAHNERQRLT